MRYENIITQFDESILSYFHNSYFGIMQITVCEICGDVGYEYLLLSCNDCEGAAAHQYVFFHCNNFFVLNIACSTDTQ